MSGDASVRCSVESTPVRSASVRSASVGPPAVRALTSVETDTALDEDDVRLLALLADGMLSEAVARQLSLSERTVRRRIRALCNRIGVDTPMQAVVWAVRAGVL